MRWVKRKEEAISRTADVDKNFDSALQQANKYKDMLERINLHKSEIGKLQQVAQSLLEEDNEDQDEEDDVMADLQERFYSLETQISERHEYFMALIERWRKQERKQKLKDTLTKSRVVLNMKQLADVDDAKVEAAKCTELIDEIKEVCETRLPLRRRSSSVHRLSPAESSSGSLAEAALSTKPSSFDELDEMQSIELRGMESKLSSSAHASDASASEGDSLSARRQLLHDVIGKAADLLVLDSVALAPTVSRSLPEAIVRVQSKMAELVGAVDAEALESSVVDNFDAVLEQKRQLQMLARESFDDNASIDDENDVEPDIADVDEIPGAAMQSEVVKSILVDEERIQVDMVASTDTTSQLHDSTKASETAAASTVSVRDRTDDRSSTERVDGVYGTATPDTVSDIVSLKDSLENSRRDSLEYRQSDSVENSRNNIVDVAPEVKPSSQDCLELSEYMDSLDGALANTRRQHSLMSEDSLESLGNDAVEIGETPRISDDQNTGNAGSASRFRYRMS